MSNINIEHPCFIDLHLHLDGSIAVETARHLAEIQGLYAPESDEELQSMLMLTPECSTLDDYLARFVYACSLLHTAEALTIASRDLMTRLKKQGVIYAEVRFAPQKSCDRGMSQREAIDAVLAGMRSVDLPSGLIISLMRGEENHQDNLETVALASEYLGHGIVGLDLAGAETIFPTEQYEHEFKIAKELGIPFTIHAGEGRGPESVATALKFGARRIGHGVRSLEDEAVVELLKKNGTYLELCPTSNLNTNLFPSYADYPLRRLMEKGVKVTLNTDNMTVSRTDMMKEWQEMCQHFDLTRAEIRQILLNSVDASFATEDTKDMLRRQIWESYPRAYIREIYNNVSEEEFSSCFSRLPKWRQEKVLAYKHKQGRIESTMAFALLQKVLKEEFGIEGEICFEYSEHEKPMLKDYPDIHFNISHCRKAVACIVGDKPVGIDVECMGRYKESLAKHVFNEEEYQTVVTDNNPDLQFTRLWTQKEAVLKLSGEGVGTDMKEVLVENADKKIATTNCDGYVYSFVGE